MKKIWKYFFLFFILSFGEGWGQAAAQNLVPNPSFEDTVMCPNAVNQVDRAIGWSSFRNTPDYFNACNSAAVSVPSNVYDFQNARSGNAYVGLYSYYSTTSNAREIIGIQLNQPLVIGQKYFVTFYASRTVNSPLNINIANNKIGARFCTVQYTFSSPVPINGISQVYTDSIISDTLNWTKIAGSFIADSSYTFLSIGNFFSDSNTSHIEYDTNAAVAYYFIDDVCVSTDSLTCEENLESVSENFESTSLDIYPNPTSGFIHIHNDIGYPSEIIIFSSTGRKVLEIYGQQESVVDITKCPTGIYLILIKQKERVLVKKIIKY